MSVLRRVSTQAQAALIRECRRRVPWQREYASLDAVVGVRVARTPKADVCFGGGVAERGLRRAIEVLHHRRDVVVGGESRSLQLIYERKL